MKTILLLIIAFAIGVFAYRSFTQEQRDEAISRIAKAGRALNGEVSPDDVEHGVPNIVREQQRKERIRQNTTWTAENRQKEPVLFLKAQLEEVDKLEEKLSVQLVELNTKKAEISRKLKVTKANSEKAKAFLDVAKKVYREAAATNAWPAKVNGFSFSQPTLKTRIVEAASRYEQSAPLAAKLTEGSATLQRKIELVQSKQRETIELRSKIETAIEMVKLDKTIKGIDGIDNQVSAIANMVEGLGEQTELSASLDDVLELSGDAKIDSAFEKIMAE